MSYDFQLSEILLANVQLFTRNCPGFNSHLSSLLLGASSGQSKWILWG